MFGSRALRDHPACLGMDTEIFYPVHVSSADKPPTAQEREALAICGRCPIREFCLDDELRHGARHQHGVIGGMTENQRRALLSTHREQVA